MAAMHFVLERLGERYKRALDPTQRPLGRRHLALDEAVHHVETVSVWMKLKLLALGVHRLQIACPCEPYDRDSGLERQPTPSAAAKEVVQRARAGRPKHKRWQGVQLDA